jgi:hypothetical protein
MHKQTAVTNALSCSTSPAAVRPNPLTTAPVPFRKKSALVTSGISNAE